MNLLSATSEQEISVKPAIFVRMFGWCSLGFLLAFLINNILSLSFDYPGVISKSYCHCRRAAGGHPKGGGVIWNAEQIFSSYSINSK